MKFKIPVYIFLLILPVSLIFIEFLLSYARGPFWLLTNVDPTYAYLIYMLDLIKNGKTMGFQHPGITIQLLGVIILKVVHFFRHTSTAIEFDVLGNPEIYLHAISYFIIVFIGVILFISGKIVYTFTQNLWMAFLMQLIPFIFMKNLMVISYVCPEPLMIITILLFSVVIIIIASNKDENKTDFYIYLLAFIAGFGLATKLLFLPFIFIPLFIMKKGKSIFIYFLIIAFIFLIWTIPIIPQYKLMFLWLKKILTHKGLYGVGDYELFNSTKYFQNIITIFKTNLVFLFFFISSFIFIFINKASKRLREISNNQKTFKLLCGVLVCQFVSVLLIAKHYSGNHYMIASSCFSGLTIVLIILYLTQINELFRINISGLINKLLIIIFIFIIIRIIMIYNIYTCFKKINTEAHLVHNKALIEFSDYAKVYYYRSSSVEFGLLFAIVCSKSVFADELRLLYGEIIYYDKVKRKFYTWDHGISIENLKKYSQNKLIFQGKPLNVDELPIEFKLKEIYKGNWEMIYKAE